MTKFDDSPTDPAAQPDVHDIMAARMTRTSPVLEEAWRYWNAKRVGGALPTREALDARAMQLILGHSMILDRVRPGTVRVRVSGRVANDLMGMETRGLPVRAFFDLLQRGVAADMIDRAFDAPATLELDLISKGDDGPIAARMLILPLLDRTGAVTKALAVLVPDRLVADGPRRFRVVRHNLAPIAVASLSVRGADGLRVDVGGMAAIDDLPQDPIEAVRICVPSAEVIHRETAPTDVPYLRVVK